MTIPARCAFTLPQGKKLPWMRGTGKYQACITPTQAKRLWGTAHRTASLTAPIGCGAFACVYPGKAPGRVIKITNDRTDLEALKKGQGIPFVPKMRGHWKLASAHRWLAPVSGGRSMLGPNAPYWPETPPEVFALDLERVRPLHGAEKGKWERRVSCLRFMFRRGREPIPVKAPKRVPGASQAPTKTTPRQMVLPGMLPPKVAARAATRPMEALSWMPKKYYPDVEYECCPKKAGAARTECKHGIRQIAEAARLLRKRGIDPRDLHAGNIGMGTDGRWKLIDLGQSGLAYGFGDEPKTLTGARRRRQR